MTFPTKTLMWQQILRPALIASVLFMLITGLLYPLLTVLAGQTLFPFQAQGSVISRDGETLGSALIGQNFTQPYYFHSRPSMTQMADPNDPSSSISHPYNAALSAASNHGPTSKKLLSAVQGRVQDYRKLNGLSAIKGYRMLLIMPDNSTAERKAAMTAYGAELILVESMEAARDLALEMQAQGKGIVLDQFSNQDNPSAHYSSTGPEIWQQTHGQVTHFISSMGTTGTIMGVSRYLKEQNPAVQIIGLQPKEGATIPGIRRWPTEYLPTIFDASRVDQIVDMGQQEAEDCMRRLAREEGIFCGVSSGGSVAAMLRVAKTVENSVLVAIICDRGDRYLSSGIYAPESI